jgi:hypothetical protein
MTPESFWKLGVGRIRIQHPRSSADKSTQAKVRDGKVIIANISGRCMESRRDPFYAVNGRTPL